MDQFVYALIRYENALSELTLRQLHRLEKIVQEHLARVRRSAMTWNANHIQLPGSAFSMIINDLNLLRTLIGPEKTDAILIVDADTMLPSSVGF